MTAGRLICALTLPWPPSANKIWRNLVIRGTGRTVLSAQGRAYRDTVARIVMESTIARTLEGADLRVSVEAFPPDRRRRDLDNIAKALLDALTHAGVWADDSQVCSLHLERRPPDGTVGRVRVVVEALLTQAQEALPLTNPEAESLAF
jgi:crossover junction endodeoxyribonuclease RusA